MNNLIKSDDKKVRCGWVGTDPDNIHYHDTEWGRKVTYDKAIFEKICLEGFQSGLSWITILRKREAFRKAFKQFDPAKVAKFGESDVKRLLADASIVRHRGKIEATINNARKTLEMQKNKESLSELVWSFAPTRKQRIPTKLADLKSETPESVALSKELRRRGFNFVGPTTMHAAMQSLGLINDHLSGCQFRRECG
ncbi:MAG: DNA-3-methyladenine glycosylase I [Ilumatobacteraceae bacterium]